MATTAEIIADLDCLDRLPPLPQVVTRLLATLGRDDVGLDTIDGIILEDPLLAARVLRSANSVAYAAKVPARTTRDALFRLGLSEVRRMALALGVVQAMPPRGGRVSYEDFWVHSLGVARISEEIARRAPSRPPGAEPDGLFLAGLFHDIGLLALINHYPGALDEIFELGRGEGLRQFEAEIEVLGTDHGELGARLAKHWQLPDYIVESLRGHHRTERAWGPFRWHAAVVGAADFLFSHEGHGDLGETLPLAMGEGIWEALGLEALGLQIDESIELAREVADIVRKGRVVLAGG
jgi:putative nucleotidyltransferase with HDIG domain